MSVPTLTGLVSGNSYEYDALVYDQVRVLPAISNYRYSVNANIRSSSTVNFQWEEVYLEETDNGIGYSMPIGYVIQMSPDLGYQTPMAHFYPDNPFFKQSDLLSIDGGILEPQDDGSVIATLDLRQYRLLLQSAPFSKYYWRAVAVSEDGSFGELGFPSSFFYRKLIIDNEWSIETTDHSTNSPSIIIRGRKSQDIIDIEINDILNVVTFNSNDHWEFSAILQPGENIFLIRAKDITDNFSTYKKVVIKYEQENVREIDVWNHYDEFGLLVGLKRIPGESNKDYKNRILDVTINLPGSSYNGVINGAIREIGGLRISDAINISLYKKQPNNPNPVLMVGSSSIIVSHDSFYISNEIHIVNPFTKSFFLKENIFDNSKISIKINNLEIPKEDIKINFKLNEITLEDKYINSIVYVSYRYMKEFRYIDYPKISDIIYALNEITYDSVSRMFIVNKSERLTGAESSENLILTDFLIINNSLSLEWSEISLREIGDDYWKFSMVNVNGTYFGTKWYGFIKQLKNISKSSWEHVVTDISVWDSGIVNNEPQAFIKRQFDTYIGAFKPKNTDIKIDSSRAYALGYVNPVDFVPISWHGPKRWKSGIGFEDDLKVSIKKLEKEKTENNNITVYITNKSVINETEIRV